jgi:diguanylate cyclase (GGDEF)-like protein
MSDETEHTGGALPAFSDLLEEAQSRFHAAEYTRSRELAEAALEEVRISGRRETLDEAEALTWFGASLTQLSQYQDALVQLKEAVDCYARLGHPELASRALNYVAVVHEELGETDRAFEIYQQALEAANRAGATEMQARILANVGEAFVNLKEYERALGVLAESAVILEPLEEHRSLYGWCLLGIARIYVDSGDHPTAFEFFQQALAAAVEGDSLRVMTEIHTALGALYVETSQIDEALIHLEQALELAKEMGIRREIYRARLELAKAHEKRGDFESALHHFKEYDRERAAVLEAVAKERIESLTAEVELGKVRHQQEVDHLRNVELAKLNEDLLEALGEIETVNRELEHANEQLDSQKVELERLSVHDSLTGVHNRRYLDDHLEKEFVRALRYGHALSLAMIDADDFKRVNDNFSHAVGDQVLKQLAWLIGEITRRSDILARYGGEEFVVVFPVANLEESLVACEKVRSAVEQFHWTEIAPALSVTVSIGVASHARCDSVSELLAAADQKLYEAKRTGKNKVCY